nr:hypothetical protein [Akkermansiaceae bacterium]
MPPRFRNLCRAAFTLGVSLGGVFSLRATEVFWTDFNVSQATGAELVDVELMRTPLDTWNFAVGHAVGDFQMGGLAAMDFGPRKAGILVGGRLESLTDDFGHDWLAWGKSGDADVRFTGSVIPMGSGRLAVCGTGEGVIGFGVNGDSQLQLEADASSAGFVAIFDPEAGAWERAFRTPGMAAEKIACEQEGTVVVSGNGLLAAKFNLMGQRLWAAPAPQGTRPERLMDARSGRPLLVALELLDGGTADAHLRLYRLDPATGAVIWERSASGPGRETPQALVLDDQDGALLAFDAARIGSRWSDSKFNNDYKKATAARTLHVVRVMDGGWHGFKGQLGGGYLPATGNAPTTLATSGGFWDGDSRTFCVPLNLQGTWLLGDSKDLIDYTGVPVVMQIPLVGMLGGAEECRITNGSGEIRNLLKLDAERRLVVGRSGAGGQALTGTIASIDQPVRFTLSVDFDDDDSDADLTLQDLRMLVAGVGGAVYSEVDLPISDSPTVAVTFVASRNAARVLSEIEGVVLEREATLKRSSYDPNLTWALPMIASGNPAAVGSTAPVTAHGTRLYLIDTSVSFSADWAAHNDNLTVALTRTIRGTNDPIAPAVFN